MKNKNIKKSGKPNKVLVEDKLLIRITSRKNLLKPKMNLRNEEKIFKSLYGDDVDGHRISHAGRMEVDEKDRKYLIYGELPFSEFALVFEEPAILKDVEKSKIFYDLGSGTGKILVEATLLLPGLEKIIGIELVRTLFEVSNQIKQKLRLQMEAADKIETIHGNFLNIDYSYQPPDIVFLHYPMHNAEDLYMRLEEKFKNELKPGVLIVSCMRRLENLGTFTHIATRKIQCPYGSATVYYHRKI
ncbi:MAG: class I SAM-dependent methyltransferase [Rickettsiales bacterium]|jgi:SAM-dependent methyltransferase|nr:class I SAM-dependent methyltransferase [Rickettsiales bacterium]